jgi:uncharacterized protein
MTLVTIRSFGHPNIRAKHKTTFQVTKESHISLKADCIIGVKTDFSCSTFFEKYGIYLEDKKKVDFKIIVNKFEYNGFGYFSNKLRMTDDKDMVFRKSSFESDRTALVNCSIAASDLPSNMVEEMKNPLNQIEIKLNLGEI